MIRLALVILLLPSLLYAQFDPTTVGSGTSVLVDVNTAYSGSVDSDGIGTDAGDGDGVEAWKDQSGNSNDVLQATGAALELTYDINGFDGTDPCLQGATGDYMYILDTGLLKNKDALTIAFLIDYSDPAAIQTLFSYINAAGDDYRLRVWWDETDTTYLNLRNPDATDNSSYSNDDLVNGSVHVVVMKIDMAGQEIAFWIDDVEVHTDTGLTGTSAITNSDSAFVPLMFTSDASSHWFTGCTAAFIIWDEALSDVDIGTVYDGLSTNFSGGTPTPTPTPTPVPSLGGSTRLMMGIGS